MKRISRLSSPVALLLANLVPLYGAFFLNWSVFSIMLTYWLESAVIGIYTVRKMKKAGGRTPNNLFLSDPFQKYTSFNLLDSLAVFFMFHYGAFMIGHLFFLAIFFGSSQVSILGIFLSIISLFISHTISYYHNYIGKAEYLQASLIRLLFSPYPHIFVMQITVILGAMLARSMGESTAGLALMVALKTIVDLSAHLAEHRKAQKNILVAHQPNSENVIVLEKESRAKRM